MYQFKVNIINSLYLLFKTTGISNKKGKRYRLLALNHTRFNQDLELLEKTGEFKIYKLPFHWQSRFLNHFYNEVDRSNIGLKKLIKKQKIFRIFLEDFLFKYYSFLKVSCVIGAATHYKQDIDWGKYRQELGFRILFYIKRIYMHLKGILNNLK